MDLQKMLDNAFISVRNEELKNSPQLLLGEMILKLEAVNDKTKPLFIDLLDKRPKGIDSWRGSYRELSIRTEDFGSYNTDKVTYESEYGNSYEQKEIGKENPTVADWLEVLKEAIGKTFVGYKGGDYLMGKNTPVWLAEYGNSSFEIEKDKFKNVYFVDVKEKDDRVYLITAIDIEEN